MSTSPLVLHFVRPYASAEEYLLAEAWTIDARTIVLIAAEELPPETLVLFDVALASGEKLIRAEAKVVGPVAGERDRPSGLRVKYRRYGATTKAFIDRAVRYQQEAAAAQPEPGEPSASPLAEPPRAPAPSLPEIVTPSLVTTPPHAGGAESLVAPASSARASEAESPAIAVSSASAVRASEPAPAPPVSASGSATPSGVHRRPFSPADVPPDREALLSRLRERARNLDADELLGARKSAG